MASSLPEHQGVGKEEGSQRYPGGSALVAPLLTAIGISVVQFVFFQNFVFYHFTHMFDPVCCPGEGLAFGIATAIGAYVANPHTYLLKPRGRSIEALVGVGAGVLGVVIARFLFLAMSYPAYWILPISFSSVAVFAAQYHRFRADR
jgi:hypothetical protein